MKTIVIIVRASLVRSSPPAPNHPTRPIEPTHDRMVEIMHSRILASLALVASITTCVLTCPIALADASAQNAVAAHPDVSDSKTTKPADSKTESTDNRSSVPATPSDTTSGAAAPASSMTLKGGLNDGSKYEDALAVECPQPTLPAEHQEQGIKTSCVARFIIDKDGKFQVALLTSTGSEEVDREALATLKRWKFKPAQLDGAPVKSTRKIRIEFEVD